MPRTLLAEEAKGRPGMSVIGYARTSTLRQDAGLDAQLLCLPIMPSDVVPMETAEPSD
jgi:hypothetical protein